MDCTIAWDRLRACVVEVVQRHDPRDGYQVLIFSDASDEFRGGCVTEVPVTEFESGMEVSDMNHEPLDFESGALKGGSAAMTDDR